ncbi:3'-5' exonuclease (plasmid) [Rossellomorea sp. AcN35-11]|nr:exonuclease domain-containing protein [Rossellomorea aquimaris]WJV32276.1 3'-5' exonuclease [Rossellomorea sp. AcN35-11]
MKRLNRIPPKRKYALFYETEFTCYENSNAAPEGFYNEPIEIALKVVDLETGKPVKYYETMIKPDAFPTLSVFCKQLTRIKQSEVDNGVPFEQLINELTEIYETYNPYIVTWSHRDKEWLMQACSKANVPFPLGPFSIHLDMANEFKIFSRIPRHITLREAFEFMGIRDNLAHRAGDELYKLVRLFEHMRKERWTPVSKILKIS